jgi:hypothetical protein
MKYFFLIFICLLFLPFGVMAEADLSLSQNSIEFSKEKLIVGDTVRIYATVKNVGDVDVSGFVSFFQGSLPIGDSQTISSRASSTPEEVYVDFVVPAGVFNIRAEIRGTDPTDENEANNLALTQLFTPIFDDDRDGVENDVDNCPVNSNVDQIDIDLDGLGDACDDDDDDDGLTDGVESELGTSPTNPDTDDDGLDDAVDPHPTQVESSIPKTPSSVVATTQSEPDSDSEDSDVSSEESLTTTTETTIEIFEPSAAPEPAEMVFEVSPKAVFVYKKINWQTFVFTVQLPDSDGYRVSWDFGDGATSNKAEVEHVFSGSGDYLVSVRLEGAGGWTDTDSVNIRVPFFSLKNPAVQAIVGVLIFSIIILLFLFPKKISTAKIKSPTASGKIRISVRHD